jgi:hypothetical protein
MFASLSFLCTAGARRPAGGRGGPTLKPTKEAGSPRVREDSIHWLQAVDPLQKPRV